MFEQVSQLALLLARVRAGDNDVAQNFVNIYAPKMLSMIRCRLPKLLQTLYDAADVLQEVWKDFFFKRINRQVFQTEAELNYYLTGMARHIILELERRHYDTQKRNIRCQLPLERAVKSQDRKLIDWRPSPEDLLTDKEQWERILQLLAPRSRQAVRMLLTGHTQLEVIAILGMSKRLLRRLLERIGSPTFLGEPAA